MGTPAVDNVLLDRKLQENATKIDAAVAAIDPRLKQIDEEIQKNNVPQGWAYFFKEDGSIVKKRMEGEQHVVNETPLEIPPDTVKIVANGNLSLAGEIADRHYAADKSYYVARPLEVFVRGDVAADDMDGKAKVNVSKDAYFEGAGGTVVAGGDINAGNLYNGSFAAKGSIHARQIGNANTVTAGKDVIIHGYDDLGPPSNDVRRRHGGDGGKMFAGGSIIVDNSTSLYGDEIRAKNEINIAGGRDGDGGALFGANITAGHGIKATGEIDLGVSPGRSATSGAEIISEKKLRGEVTARDGVVAPNAVHDNSLSQLLSNLITPEDSAAYKEICSQDHNGPTSCFFSAPNQSQKSKTQKQ